jgi:VIT family
VRISAAAKATSVEELRSARRRSAFTDRRRLNWYGRSRAALPLLVVAATPAQARVGAAVVVTLIALGLLGDLGARLGGAPRRRAAVRVVAWGAVAMAITAGIGALVGTVA